MSLRNPARAALLVWLSLAVSGCMTLEEYWEAKGRDLNFGDSTMPNATLHILANYCLVDILADDGKIDRYHHGHPLEWKVPWGADLKTIHFMVSAVVKPRNIEEFDITFREGEVWLLVIEEEDGSVEVSWEKIGVQGQVEKTDHPDSVVADYLQRTAEWERVSGLYWFKPGLPEPTETEVEDTLDDLEAQRVGILDAVKLGDEAKVQSFLEAGADPDAQRMATGKTALMEAVEGGHAGVARLLLEAGAQVNAADNVGATALMSAAYAGDAGTVGLLLERRADVHATTRAGSTPLCIAAWRGNTAAAQALLEAGADVNARDGDGRTPLTLARNGGHSELAGVLEARGGTE